MLTDGGVERLIVHQVDIVPDFYWFIRCQLKNHEPQHRLFPRAVQILGWRHQVDLIVRKGLFACPWLPRWLSGFKSITYFLRDKNLLKDLAKRFQDDGLHGLSDMVAAHGADPHGLA